MDMVAYYGTREEKPLNSLQEIWDELVSLPGLWESFGTSTDPSSHAGRADVDAPLEAKEGFINCYLDLAQNEGLSHPKIAGLTVDYLGGIRYELVEMQLQDESGDDHHYLRMRASGTEPINRIYIESSNLETGQKMMKEVLRRLELITMDVLAQAHSPWHLVDMLTQTTMTADTNTLVKQLILDRGWDLQDILDKIQEMSQTLEKRNRKVINTWFNSLRK